MKYLDLLGIQLKNNFLVDLFETYDVEVIYDYDRLHEGQPDAYRAELPELGLEFVFNEGQLLKSLFIAPGEIEGYCPIEEDARLQVFASKIEAIQFAEDSRVGFVEGKADLLGTVTDWVRLEYTGYSIHYEFVDGLLEKMTLVGTGA